MVNIRTSCEKCVFAIKDKNAQVGCELGRLEKFIAREEAELDDASYIINRFCNTCRDQPISKEAILKEVELSYTFIVYSDNDYWITLKGILRQKIKPKAVFVVFDNLDGFDRERCKEYQEIFKDQDITLIFKRWFEPTPFTQMVDEVVDKIQTQFYCSIKGQIQPDFIEKINNKINIDLDPVNAYFPSCSIFGAFISKGLHKLVNGNKDYSIIEKCKELLEGKTDKEKSTIIFEKQ